LKGDVVACPNFHKNLLIWLRLESANREVRSEGTRMKFGEAFCRSRLTTDVDPLDSEYFGLAVSDAEDGDLPGIGTFALNGSPITNVSDSAAVSGQYQ
jgi:hypothetical protein